VEEGRPGRPPQATGLPHDAAHSYRRFIIDLGLSQPIDERLRHRGSGGAAIDDLAVGDVFAVESFVVGLIALERRAVETEAGEDPLVRP